MTKQTQNQNPNSSRTSPSAADLLGQMAMDAAPGIIQGIATKLSPVLTQAADAVLETAQNEFKKKAEETIAATAANLQEGFKHIAEQAELALSDDEDDANNDDDHANSNDRIPSVDTSAAGLYTKHKQTFAKSVSGLFNVAVTTFISVIISGLSQLGNFLGNLFSDKKTATQAKSNPDVAFQLAREAQQQQNARQAPPHVRPASAPASVNTSPVGESSIHTKLANAALVAVVNGLKAPVKDALTTYARDNKDAVAETITQYARENKDVALDIASRAAVNVAKEGTYSLYERAASGLANAGRGIMNFFGFGSGANADNNPDDAFVPQQDDTAVQTPVTVVHAATVPATTTNNTPSLRSSLEMLDNDDEAVLSRIPGGFGS